MSSITSPGGKPAGSTTQVQFNEAGHFAADAGLTFDRAARKLIAPGVAAWGMALQTDTPGLVMTDTASPANARVFRLAVSQQQLLFDALDDTLGSVQARMTLTRTGDLSVRTVALANGQVRFQNHVASSDPATLDDYREAPWTPTLTSSAGASGQSYSLQSAEVTKIGNLVSLSARVVLAAVGTFGGNVQLTLPYIGKGINHRSVGMVVFSGLGAVVGAVSLWVLPGQYLADLLYTPVGGATGQSFAHPGLFASGTDLNFSVQYQTD